MAKAERERRNAVRAEKKLPSPAINLKKPAPVAGAQIEELKAWIDVQLSAMELRQRELLAGMEARLGARYTGFPDFGKAYPNDMKITSSPATGTAVDPNEHQYRTLAALAEMSTVDD